jgi:hypothetical protein
MATNFDVNVLTQAIQDLTDEQLTLLADAICDLKESRAQVPVKIEIQEQQHVEIPNTPESKKGCRTGKHLEKKHISGHDYWYERYWDGDIHRSVYIGVEKPGS